MKRRKFFFPILVILFISMSLSAEAQERFEFYNGARSLGMGGAQVAIVNDETALLVNPAALGKLRDGFLTVIDPDLDLGVDTLGIVQEKGLATSFSIEKLKDALVENPGKYFHARAQAFPSVVFPNFGFGVLAKYSFDGGVSKNNTSDLRLDYTNDLAAVIGYNFRFFGGRVKFGFNVKFLSRLEVHRDLDLSTYTGGFSADDLGKEGFAIGSDIGLVFTAPWEYLPTLAIVARDVGDTTYTTGNGIIANTSERPDVTKQVIDIGLGVYPILNSRSRMTWSLEMKDIMDVWNKKQEIAENDRDLLARLHFGGELNLYDSLFLRVGMNQRYWTAGIEIAMQKFQLQFSSYGEEIGTKSSPREDRRMITKIAYRF